MIDLFWLHWVFVAACGLSVVEESGDCSPVEVCGLSIAVSLIAERGLEAAWASVVAA